MNDHEQEVMEDLQARGYFVVRGGWPDFLAVAPDGFTFGVEDKVPPDDLSLVQVENHKTLLEAGFSVVTHYDPQDLDATLERARTLDCAEEARRLLQLEQRVKSERSLLRKRQSWMGVAEARERAEAEQQRKEDERRQLRKRHAWMGGVAETRKKQRLLKQVRDAT